MKLSHFVSATVFAGILLVASVASAATIIRVDASDTHSDAGGCGTVANPCNTINAAVANSHPGDTIKVAPGVYPEWVYTSNKNLTFLGAQANNPGTRNTTPSQESVVGAIGGAFQIDNDNITINGFTIRGVHDGVYAGIHMSPYFSGYKILNNIIEDNSNGIYLNNKGTIQAVIRGNLIRNNNVPSPGTHSGIYADSAIAAVRNVVIDNNTFSGHFRPAIELVGNQTDIKITNNTSNHDNGFLRLFRASGINVNQNTITNSGGDAISMVGAVTDSKITNNQIDDPAGNGISATGELAPTNFTTQILNNTINRARKNGMLADTGALRDSKISRNSIDSSLIDGIRMNSGSINNVLSLNILTNNNEYDARDNTVGSMTAGTGNHWTNNVFSTALPAGLH